MRHIPTPDLALGERAAGDVFASSNGSGNPAAAARHDGETLSRDADISPLTPYYQDASVTLYHGDALEILPMLATADAIVSDPPFNAGKDFANDSLEPKQWRAFCTRLAMALWETGAGNVLIEVGKNDEVMRQELDRWLRYRYAMALNYTNSMRNGAVGYADFGLILWYGEGKCHQRYKDRLDSALHDTRGEFSHPSPKQVKHYQKLVEMFSPEGGTVIDPFAGSGTTLRAAKNIGRKAVGIEISEPFCEIAAKRMAQEVLNFAGGDADFGVTDSNISSQAELLDSPNKKDQVRR